MFDPALKHFPSAFRPGDPEFSDPEAAGKWTRLRRLATDHVLRRIAESTWGDGLVLRGSRLLRAWLGEEAREPGDLDWVADSSAFGSSSRQSELFDGLSAVVLAPPFPQGVEFAPDAVATDEIWTYDRAPGRRVVFPWRTRDLPGGAVQVDVVFGEPLFEPARREPILVADLGYTTVRAARPGQSLAWKLLWLMTDMHPQGKDLYDAVLLAERFPLSARVLERTLRDGGAVTMPLTATGLVRGWDVDWDNFQAEYPWVAGDADHWLARLEVALGPTFS